MMHVADQEELGQSSLFSIVVKNQMLMWGKATWDWFPLYTRDLRETLRCQAKFSLENQFSWFMYRNTRQKKKSSQSSTLEARSLINFFFLIFLRWTRRNNKQGGFYVVATRSFRALSMDSLERTMGLVERAQIKWTCFKSKAKQLRRVFVAVVMLEVEKAVMWWILIAKDIIRVHNDLSTCSENNSKSQSSTETSNFVST